MVYESYTQVHHRPYRIILTEDTFLVYVSEQFQDNKNNIAV